MKINKRLDKARHDKLKISCFKGLFYCYCNIVWRIKARNFIDNYFHYIFRVKNNFHTSESLCLHQITFDNHWKSRLHVLDDEPVHSKSQSNGSAITNDSLVIMKIPVCRSAKKVVFMFLDECGFLALLLQAFTIKFFLYHTISNSPNYICTTSKAPRWVHHRGIWKGDCIV